MRVLLVDDDQATRFICRRVLARLQAGISIDEAEDATRALECLRSASYDAVLSDYRLGAGSGIDVLAAAREVQPTAFRALMTGFADPALQQLARQQAGVQAFIEKPMTSREFEVALRDRFLVPLAEQGRQEG